MNNNDRLTRLRYALDIKDQDMIEIFRLGGVTISREDYLALLKKIDEDNYEKDLEDEVFERFLNGMIISQRGVKEGDKPVYELRPGNANNIFLKKLKIALSLTTDKMLEIWADEGITISKSELSAFLRKEGHKNYKTCGDNFTRNFLKGLMKEYR
ncbi:MAG: DUF1456 family protein [Vagococcus fluvialis]|uniref:DUF1456 family protein n=1 Tax=Vagococcus fluvialis TaxID=2738 RepID=UPI000A32E5AF|nr:DUF1456 family protein [Vagococcus fluvialis]MBO0419815.1 DUF1456 family protein [Vagococcus fluvialis]MBO0437477.1 DUF1456 family protein [Vagococcus fluvialis]MDT2781483.1 DUF1456 family protein [Vagococcus fluvialis]OTP26285.1 hypothetical protein A5798_002833 [Enterococcus sp. 6C8_DIV0013]